jgi:hypothetical protein
MTDPNEAEDKTLLDATDVVCDIGNTLEGWDGSDLAKLHNDVCGSEIVYVGDSLFAKNKETLERAREIGKELDANA